jgi:hypothetical protein
MTRPCLHNFMHNYAQCPMGAEMAHSLGQECRLSILSGMLLDTFNEMIQKYHCLNVVYLLIPTKVILHQICIQFSSISAGYRNSHIR